MQNEKHAFFCTYGSRYRLEEIWSRGLIATSQEILSYLVFLAVVLFLDQDHGCLKGRAQHLVRVPGDGVGFAQAGRHVVELRGDQERASPAGVHMQPDFV